MTYVYWFVPGLESTIQFYIQMKHVSVWMFVDWKGMDDSDYLSPFKNNNFEF